MAGAIEHFIPYQRWLKERGCGGISCSGCHCAFDHNRREFSYRCVIVELCEFVEACDKEIEAHKADNAKLVDRIKNLEKELEQFRRG